MTLVRRLFALTLPFAPLARRVLPLAALATMVAIGLQFLFAGIGVFGASIAGISGFDAHFWMGGVVHLLIGLLLAAAIVGRQSRGMITLTAGLFVVATVMMALPRLSTVELRAFHPVGALFVAWLTYTVFQWASAARRAESAEAPEAAPVPVVS